MFTQKTKNAIRIISFLINNQEVNKKYGAEEIADNLKLNKPFISKILQELTKNNIISSSKGRGGGFFLSEENKQKTIIEVVNVFENTKKIAECILGLPECGDENPCILHSIYKEFKWNITDFLKKNLDQIVS